MSEVTDLSTANKQKLVSDMKVVVADAEEILRATAGVAGDKMGDLRERFGERLRDAKLRLAGAEAALVILCACSPAYSHEDTELLAGDVPPPPE